MAFPGTYNFSYYAGDTFEFFIYPKNSVGGVFDDLANYNPKFTIASTRGNVEDVVLASSASTQLAATVNSVNGISSYISCTIKPEGGRLLSDQSYLYDVEIKHKTNGKVHTLLTGAISVTQDITRY
jgi:hypothetical protein